MVDCNRKCLVCVSPNAALHLGMDVCRACANFFKRSLVKNCRYPCRQGNHNCAVVKAVRPMCRGCRFDKCVAVGLNYGEKMRAQKEVPKAHIYSPPVIAQESLLDRITKEHGVCVERRRVREIKMIKEYELDRLPHINEEIYHSTFDCALASFNIAISENWQFFQTVYPPLRLLPYEEQREFFRLCVPQFALAECFHRTKRTFGGFKKYLMCSLFMCAEITNSDQWVREDEPNRSELIDSLRAHSKEQTDIIVPSFEKADICERELHALLALLLCEADIHSELADRFKLFLQKVRTEILKDLHRFYTEEMRLFDYSTRLGNLLTICHTFREGNALFQEYFRMQVTIFDLYVTATQLQDLFL